VRARLDKSEHMLEKMKERLVTHDDMADELRRMQTVNADYLAKIDALTTCVGRNTSSTNEANYDCASVTTSTGLLILLLLLLTA
jgi:hypothetical protein